jgi:hypothetical protein
MEIKEASKEGLYVDNLDGERVHSRYNPVREAHRRLPDTPANNHRYVVLGAGLGYVLNQIARMDDEADVLLVEPNPSLLEEGIDRGIWSPESLASHQLITPETDDLQGAVGSFLTIESHDDFELVNWTPYENRYSDFFETVLEAISRVQTLHRNSIDVLLSQGKTWLKHLRENLDLLASHVTPDRGTFDHELALVSAGPSLDEQIDWLKRHQQELIILCGNTTGPILRHHGIEADTHVAVDANEPVVEDLGASKLNHLMISPFVDPAVTDRHTVGHTLLGTETPLTEWLVTADFIPTVQPGGAISATMVKWLSDRTDQRQFLLGCDMEAREGRYYARGTVREYQALSKLNRFQTLPGWHFDKAQSKGGDHSLRNEREWFIEQSRSMENLVVPKCPPTWWEGDVEEGVSGDTAPPLSFQEPDSGVVRDWVQNQFEQINGLIHGRSTTDAWSRFKYWTDRIVEDSDRELDRWKNRFQSLVSELS